METTLVADPNEALDLLTRNAQIDVALIDYLMPDMTGVDLARQLRRRVGDKSPPLVLFSSVRSSKAQLADVTGEFTAYLPKPIKPSTLFNILIARSTCRRRSRSRDQERPRWIARWRTATRCGSCSRKTTRSTRRS